MNKLQTAPLEVREFLKSAQWREDDSLSVRKSPGCSSGGYCGGKLEKTLLANQIVLTGDERGDLELIAEENTKLTGRLAADHKWET